MAFFHNAVADEFESVNQLILSSLKSDVGLVENIGGYIVDSGGKRLRPVLVLLSALANGYNCGRDHIKVAAIIEFIHTATLLHDDVVDVSALRRGRETANEIWGNAPSVLVGDFLYSRAFQMLVEICDMSIMSVFADATNVISEGEVQQMANAGNPDLDESTYKEVIYRKTAKLFEAGMECGAILAGSEIQAMKDYGKHLGMAFQIADDVLDLQGDVSLIGKNIGDDLSEGKMTLPMIYARDHCDTQQKEIIRDAIRNKSSENFDQILKIVSETGGVDYSLNRAREHSNLALKASQGLPEGKYKKVLTELAVFAVTRDI
ncbi:polyprenyl synthetase family protein [Porticoccaceae bacterium]|jgi:octaprenyl-diphosphate synthase|nr:polyprenyl synthetase family protein [Porticoccaceae bacterium]